MFWQAAHRTASTILLSIRRCPAGQIQAARRQLLNVQPCCPGKRALTGRQPRREAPVVSPAAGITEMAVRELGPNRVVFGSDAPGRSFASQLAKVYGADVPEEAKHRIFSTNLKQLLQPILTDKGIKTG